MHEEVAAVEVIGERARGVDDLARGHGHEDHVGVAERALIARHVDALAAFQIGAARDERHLVADARGGRRHAAAERARAHDSDAHAHRFAPRFEIQRAAARSASSVTSASANGTSRFW